MARKYTEQPEFKASKGWLDKFFKRNIEKIDKLPFSRNFKE